MARKILIVDDSPVARMIVRKCLPNDEEFEVFEANNGAEGLEKFKEIHPDVTLLDLTMPVMDGFQALEEIRKIDTSAVVLVLTADIQQKTVQKVTELGATMVIQKPPSAESIQSAFNKINQTL